MPLHDWTDRRGWEGVHHLWITELLRLGEASAASRLPGSYRLGSDSRGRCSRREARCEPRRWPEEPVAESAGPTVPSLPYQEPDEEVAVALFSIRRHACSWRARDA